MRPLIRVRPAIRVVRISSCVRTAYLPSGRDPVALVIPLSQPLGLDAGPDQDGVLVGALPRVAATVLYGTRLGAPSAVRHGDAVGGTVSYTDVTAAAVSGAADDFRIANGSDPSADELLIDVEGAGVLSGLVLEQTTAGVGSGTWAPVVDYPADGRDVTVALDAAGAPASWFRAIGAVVLPFAAHLDPADVQRSRVSGRWGRWLRIRLSSVSSMTTAPAFGRLWLRRPTPGYTATAPASVLPITDDLTWIVLPRRACKLAVVLTVASAAAEWVYWNGSSIQRMTLVRDPSARLTGVGTHMISFVPPADWASRTITDDAGAAHTGYLIGLRATSDAPAPVAPPALTVQGLAIEGAGVAGARPGSVYDEVAVHVRETSPSPVRLLVVDGQNGAWASLTLAANAARTSASLSAACSAEGPLVAVVLDSDTTGREPADGALYVTE